MAAGHTEKAIRNHGAKGALIKIVQAGKRTEGLLTLRDHGRMDCAYEQIAVDFADELPVSVVDTARVTLASFANESD